MFRPTTPEVPTLDVITTPAVPPVVTNKAQALDRYFITDMRFVLDKGNIAATKLLVTWTEGYENHGSFVIVHTKRASLSGRGLLAAMNTACSASNTRYEEVQGAVWAILQSETDPSTGQPYIGAGTVS